MKIELQNISKRYGDELLFENISLEFLQASSTALLGMNGSGKSTLLQIIATYVIPTKGEVKYYKNDSLLNPESIYHTISYCAPYLEVTEEMTLKEFLQYHFSFKKALLPVDEIISYIGLQHTKDKQIEKFSSGMKQRVKLAQAIFADTNVLFLDEPCTNLDEQGIQLYYQLIQEFTQNRILIVASNDEKGYRVCKEQFMVGQ